MEVDHFTVGRTLNAPIDPDIQKVASSTYFAELIERRSRFVRLALAGASLWFGAFLMLTAYAHDFMGHLVAPGVTVAYLLGLSQFALVWIVTAAYLRASTRVFVPLEKQALETISDHSMPGGSA
ncbi:MULTISPECIES: DUF485 domain-containing protein [Rhodococcus]|uniref:DUF485 domain-containing protein n=1 Tax=Rhodococcus TaxID=1827 RepID=UPI00077A745A|nr:MULTISPECIES: DUF485 domain-containing protein [Rhodococcus]KXX56685.1 hypothetical protein AZG88_13210 [Rhodococcus sp. LB1]PBC51436.1 DUF485 domain-containing protein [Rhodococcus sp. ACPA1]QSE86157.1 DUF485 domain-containing protein [Rhodococcus koreensis]